jgi:hypothetical protein
VVEIAGSTQYGQDQGILLILIFEKVMNIKALWDDKLPSLEKPDRFYNDV